MDTVGQVIRVPNMREGYTAIAKAVAEHGDTVSPRGQRTREFQDAMIIVEDPYDTLPTGINRNLVPGIAAVESAQLLAGESRAELVTRVGPTFAQFAEDDGEFWGAYGRRTAGQFEQIETRLKADRSSRQAHVTIWDSKLDLQTGRRDFPCTCSYTFTLRKDQLHMTTFMRSNDVWLGLVYDAFQHSRVQIAMASVLGVEVGQYRHHAVSLHVYERDLPKIEALTQPQSAPTFFPVIEGSTWSEVKHRARLALDVTETGLDVDEKIVDMRSAESLQWYINAMIKAIQNNENKDKGAS